MLLIRFFECSSNVVLRILPYLEHNFECNDDVKVARKSRHCQKIFF